MFTSSAEGTISASVVALLESSSADGEASQLFDAISLDRLC